MSGFGRRETIVSVKAEFDELKEMAALLAQVSTMLANLGSAPNAPTYTPQGGKQTTAPPTPNYGSHLSSTANVAPPGGGINPAALGGGYESPTSTFGGGISAPVGTAGAFAGGGNIALQSVLTITASSVQITAQNVVITGPGGASAGVGAGGSAAGGTASPGAGGGQVPPNVQPPQPPPPPSPPSSPISGPMAALRMFAGHALGNAQMFMPEGEGSAELASQYYMGSEVGNTVNRLVQPFANEMIYRAGNHFISPEDITAMRWRGLGTGVGSVLGGVAGLLTGTPMGVGAGVAVGAGVGGSFGDYFATVAEREKATRLSLQDIAFGMGDSNVGNLKAIADAAFGPREKMPSLMPENATEWLSPEYWLARRLPFALRKQERDQKRDLFAGQTAEAVGTFAPEILYNSRMMQNFGRDFEAGQESYAGQLGAYVRMVAQDPLLSPLYSRLISKDTTDIDRQAAGEMALLAAGRGDLGAARELAAAAHSTHGRVGTQISPLFARAQGFRGRESLGEAGFEVEDAMSAGLAATGYGIRAGRELLRGSGGLAEEVAGATDEVRFWEQRVAETKNPDVKSAAQVELDRARTKAARLRMQQATLPGRAAEMAFEERNVVAESHLTQRQAGLQSYGRTHLFDHQTANLYKGIESAIREEIEAYSTLLRDYRKAGLGPEKTAPIQGAIARLQDQLAETLVQAFEQQWNDATVKPETRLGIAGAKMRALTGTGQLYGSSMQSVFNIERASTDRLFALSQLKYEDAVRQFGPNSRQALEAEQEMEQRRADRQTLPFQQIEQKYNSLGGFAGTVGDISRAQSNIIVIRGGGSNEALPSSLGALEASRVQERLARERLAEDTRAGAGQDLLARDQLGIVSARLNVEQQQLGLATFQEPAGFSTFMRHQRNLLTRQQMSWTEPGNMLDTHINLARGYQAKLRAINAYEKRLEQSGEMTPAMRDRIDAQREDVQMQAFQERVSMEDGWVDRLTAQSIGAPSFYATARPTFAEAAEQLEHGQTVEGFRQYRGWGMVSKRGYDYEKMKGFTTSGMSDLNLFPGDIATQVLGGRRRPQVAQGSISDASLDAMLGLGGGTGTGEIVSEQRETNRLLRLIAGGSGGVPGNSPQGHGVTPQGGMAIEYHLQTQALGPAGSDVGGGLRR